MGDRVASLELAADVGGTVVRFVDVFLAVYVILILAYVLLSWFQVPSSLAVVQRFLHDVCDPYLRIFRRVIPPLGPLDLSPMVAILVLIVVRSVVSGLVS